MSRFQFFTSCPNWTNYLPVEDLNSMVRGGKEITRKTFLKYVDPESMRHTEDSCGYDRLFPMSKDPFIGYYKSTVRGCPVVYFLWSRMEYVFGDLACVMRSQE